VATASERTAPAPADDREGDRSRLTAEVDGRVGSRQEAVWIVEHAEAHPTGGSGGVRTDALALADRRAAGEPLQYVLGTWAFRSLELQVDRRVLIPRPETSRWWRWPWSSWPVPLPGATTRATTARWSASTWGPARAPSPCRWPSRGRASADRSRCGRPMPPRTRSTWPAPTATPWRRPTPGRPPGSPSPRARGSPRSRRAWPGGSTSWSPIPRMCPRPSSPASTDRARVGAHGGARGATRAEWVDGTPTSRR